MKKTLVFMLGTLLLLASCDHVSVINPDLNEIEGWEGFQSVGVSGEYHLLSLVKFKDEDFKNYVCVGHRMMQKENGETIPFVYDKDTLGLAHCFQLSDLSNTFPSDSIAMFAEEMLSLCGTSPYMELADGYYLIDWRWFGLARPYGTDCYNMTKHCFLTDTRWEDLGSLASTWLPREVSECPFAEWAVISLDHLDRYRGCYFDSGWYTYNPSALHAYLCMYFPQYEYVHREMNRPYEEFVQYCDSMYAVYQQCLTEVIKKGDLHQVARRYVYE